MKIFLLIATILIFNPSKSQIPIEAFKSALKSKKYSVFQKMFDKALKIDYSIECGNKISRQLFGDYDEVYYEIHNRYQLNESTHYLKIILKGNNIIFYNFNLVKIKSQNEKIITTTVTIDSFKNHSACRKLNNNFKQLFKADLKESDLWQIKTVGKYCGLRYDDKNIQEFDQMINLVNNNKRDSLLLLLKSANLETQMFGLWGYNFLLKAKTRLSKNELEIIKAVIQKESKGEVCIGGCEIQNLNPREFIDKYSLKELPE